LAFSNQLLKNAILGVAFQCGEDFFISAKTLVKLAVKSRENGKKRGLPIPFIV
jgi:hypothetical protein